METNDGETNDGEIIGISDSDQEVFKEAAMESVHAKRRLRRGSSLFGSPVVHRDSGTDASTLLYIAKLKNEKSQWLRFQEQTIAAKSKKVEPNMKCEFNDLTTELKNYCNGGPDMEKFAADAKEFLAKLTFYKKMENYHAEKMKYAETRIKESVNEVATKVFVDEIDEKIYLK